MKAELTTSASLRFARRCSGGWCVILLSCLLAASVSAQTARVKRISLMTPDLDQSITFFTGVVGFTLDFEGTLPANGEPFLGPVFNIDTSRPIRRALLSTRTESRGLFLIEHPEAPLPDVKQPTVAVMVIEVEDLNETLARAKTFGSVVSDIFSDTTPEGRLFREAMINSPGGHRVLLYEVGALADGRHDQAEK